MIRLALSARAVLALATFFCSLSACTGDQVGPTEPTFRLPIPGVAVCYADCPSPIADSGVWDPEHPELTPPALENPAYVATLIDQWFPSTVYRPGVRGKAVVWIRVESSGEPVEVRLKHGLGLPPLDTLVVDATTAARFSPAVLGDEPIALWVSMPITF